MARENTRDAAVGRLEAGEDRLEGRTDLAQRAVHAGRRYRGREQIAVAARRRGQASRAALTAAASREALRDEAGELLALNLILVHNEHLDVVFSFHRKRLTPMILSRPRSWPLLEARLPQCGA